jgi:hypothetical protein
MSGNLLLCLLACLLLDLQWSGSSGWAQGMGQTNVSQRPDAGVPQPPGRDVFGEIGERSLQERHGLLKEVRPPILPRRTLESRSSDPCAAFIPPERLDTPEELDAELVRQRALHAEFLEDLAPPLPSFRDTVRLEEFQWRLETDADRADFQHTMSGGGAWTMIRVPHFGGPIGRAVAYYRTTFPVNRAMLTRGAVFVRFGAVDYKAHVFVNGHYLGSHEGFFAPFEFDCTASVREGVNTLLVKVENDAIYMGNDSWGEPEEGDKLYAATNLGWDDPVLGWRHCPPGFGIYQDVFVESRAPLHLADVWVRPQPDRERAEAWVEVWNQDRKNRPASLEISVYGQNFRQTVIGRLSHTPRTRIIPGVGDLQKPTDNQEVTLTMGPGMNVLRVPLAIPSPRLWDPRTPWLYQIQVRLLDDSGRVLDAARRQFGMRTFRQVTETVPRGRLFLNGREIRLRGANTMGFEQQNVFRKDFRQLVDDILLAKICNMNYLRLTQRPVQPQVYEYCDRLGLITQTDLPLFGCLRYNKFAEAVRQAEEMERLVRAHPCNIMISYINEPFPNASGKPHRHLTRPDLEAFFAAADRAVRALNPDRVIKHVEGDYDPPSETLPDNHCYCGWYNGHGLELGKLHRGYWFPVSPEWVYACGEFGAEGLDPADLMRRRYPRQWLPDAEGSPWSPEAIPGAQTGKFHYMWFDTQHTLEDWVRVSQRHQAWATRLFAERFRRDNRMVSFAIHLFIDAFPASWMKTIMDCERRPKPAYFAYRDALEPLTVSIRTDRWAFTSGDTMRFEFWVCNDTPEAPKALRLRWQIEENGRVTFARQTPALVEPLRATFQGYAAPKAPRVDRRTRYTLRLALADGEKILRDTQVEYEVFPTPSPLGNLPVSALGTGKARQLLRDVGAKPGGHNTPLFLVDDYAAYVRQRGDIDKAVAAGARAVFLELPAGEYEIGGSRVHVEECVMRPREFVSRATGHPLVSGFEPEEFRCWYDPKAGYFRPLVAAIFEAEGWTPILTSGNGVWGGGEWKRMLAAAEQRSGKGAFIICQVALAGRTSHNPVADLFARRLLGW